MKRIITVALALTIAVAFGYAEEATDPGVLVLKKGASRSGPAYEGGIIRFTDVWLSDQLVHYPEPEGDIPLRLSIAYEVLETADVLLNSRFGTEYWRLYNFTTDELSAFYTLEDIDMSVAEEGEVSVESAEPNSRYGAIPARGLCGIRGHYYFLIDRPSREYIGAIKPPAFFDQPEVCAKLHVTLADLSDYTLEVAECESSWEPEGTFRTKVMVTDAQGDSFPVVQMPATASAGEWSAELTTQMDYLNRPTGWMTATLPEDVPNEVQVEATVSVMGPEGHKERTVSATFDRGEGQTTEAAMSSELPEVELPRNDDGVIRETRAAWMWGSRTTTPEAVTEAVDRAHRAGLNALVVSATGGDALIAKSDLWGMREDIPEGFDPLQDLIEKAHAVGIEVHPWFSVMYRRQGFRDWFPEEIDMVQEDGSVQSRGADMHCKAFRDFMVDVMVGIARDYDVDGIHLDYIRSMGKCYCERCQREFEEQFGKPLTEATDEDWVQWQGQAIYDIVKRTAEGVREVNPDAKISCAVFSNMEGGAMQGQQAPQWAREGLVDIVMPMDYKMQTLELRASEDRWLAALDDDAKLCTGICAYARTGDGPVSRPPELVREQVELIRSMGIHGYTLFRLGFVTGELLEAFESEINEENAVPYFR